MDYSTYDSREMMFDIMASDSHPTRRFLVDAALAEPGIRTFLDLPMIVGRGVLG